MARKKLNEKVILKDGNIQVTKFNKEGSEKVYLQAEFVPMVKVIILEKGDTGKIIINHEYDPKSSRNHKHSYRLCGGPVFDSINGYLDTKHSEGSIRHLAHTVALRYVEEQLGFHPNEDAMESLGVESNTSNPEIGFDTHWFALSDYKKGGMQEEKKSIKITPQALSPKELNQYFLSGLFYEYNSYAKLIRFFNDSLGVGLHFGKKVQHSSF